MTTASHSPYDAIPRAEFRREFDDAVRALREKILTLETGVAIERFVALSDELKLRTNPIRKQLIETCLDWTDEERAMGGWMHASNQRMGSLGRRIVTVATKKAGGADETVVHVAARSLQHIGNGVKAELANGRVASRDYRELHALMRLAISLDCAKAKVTLMVQGAPMSVSLEALYFRALLLARFAHGVITMPQIEILDWWIWQWRGILASVPQATGPNCLRADLESSGGLRLGPGAPGHAAIYLPAEPLAEAYRWIVAEFHAGRVDRGASAAAALPVAEHVAVLEVLRRGLSRGEKGLATRDARRVAEGTVEVLVDIAEIIAKGFACEATAGHPAFTMDFEARPSRSAIARVYEQAKRMLTLYDTSQTGLGLEGGADSCRGIAIGSLLGIRLSPSGPVEVCRVVRRLQDGGADRVTIGVRRLTSAAQVLPVTCESSGSENSRMRALLFVPGEDSSGSQDGFLVPDSLLRERIRFESELDDGAYAFRFNRVRQKGRGWSLAGIEVVSVKRPQAVRAGAAISRPSVK